MKLDEAIKHCEEVAEANERTCKAKPNVNLESYLECAAQHRELAEWLKLLKEIQESGDCNICKVKRYCRYVPEIGDKVRYNCPFFNGRIWHDGEVGESE